MRLNNWQQRKLDEESGRKMDRYAAWKAKQPCKRDQPDCEWDGSCLRCDVDAGEVCPEARRGMAEALR